METQNYASNDTPPRVCWACGARLGQDDNYCGKCGKGQGRFVSWYYKHWGIIVATLFGLGPFGLYLVWRSPVLSKNAKLIYTGLIALLTWYVCRGLFSLWLMVQSVLNGFQLPVTG